MTEIVYLTCPFCAEKDFDRIGLKNHLLQWGCPELEEVGIEEEAENERRRQASIGANLPANWK